MTATIAQAAPSESVPVHVSAPTAPAVSPPAALAASPGRGRPAPPRIHEHGKRCEPVGEDVAGTAPRRGERVAEGCVREHPHETDLPGRQGRHEMDAVALGLPPDPPRGLSV